jgi:hypothetical protein
MRAAGYRNGQPTTAQATLRGQNGPASGGCVTGRGKLSESAIAVVDRLPRRHGLSDGDSDKPSMNCLRVGRCWLLIEGDIVGVAVTGRIPDLRNLHHHSMSDVERHHASRDLQRRKLKIP